MGKLRPIIRKVDANHAEIVKAFRAIGYSVLSLAALGHGAPDILVGKYDKNFAFEIKDGSLSASRKKLTSDEQDFASTWRGQYSVIESVAQVIAFDRQQWSTHAVNY